MYNAAFSLTFLPFLVLFLFEISDAQRIHKVQQRIPVSFATGANYRPCGIYYNAYLYRDLINVHCSRYNVERIYIAFAIFLLTHMQLILVCTGKTESHCKRLARK